MGKRRSNQKNAVVANAYGETHSVSSDDLTRRTGVLCSGDPKNCLCFEHLNARLRFYSRNPQADLSKDFGKVLK